MSHKPVATVPGMFCTFQTYAQVMDELQSKVEEWLSKQGFPLEFRVARTLNGVGLPSFQGRYVRDPQSDELRETDVISSLHHESRDILCRTSVVVECKWSRDRPWVLFTGNDIPTPEAQMVQTIASPFGEGVLWHASSDTLFQNLFEWRRHVRFAFGGRRALGSNDNDQFYAAVQGVIGAAVSLAARDDLQTKSKASDSRMFAHVVYPVVVIDAGLFEAYLDGTELRTRRIEKGTVLWHGYESRSLPVAVDIVTVEAFDKYAAQLSTHCQEMVANLQNPAGEVRFALQSGIRSKLFKQHRPSVPVPQILKPVMTGFEWGYVDQNDPGENAAVSK